MSCSSLSRAVTLRLGRVQAKSFHLSCGRTRTQNAFRSPAAKGFTRTGPSLKEQLLAPAGAGVFNIGRGFVIGGAAVGLGTLCYYGLGISNQTGAIDTMAFWPQYVKDRVKATYLYFGGGLCITAASAVMVFRTPALLRLVTKNSMMSLVATFAAMIGTGAVARSIEYRPGIGPKQLAWALHCGVMGAVVAPLAFLGGPILIRAAWMTAGICGGLSLTALCAPNDKFANMGGALGMGLGAVLLANIGSLFLPPTSLIGAGLYSVWMYGGLVLFGAFLLYDTQKIIHNAQHTPYLQGYHEQYGFAPYQQNAMVTHQPMYDPVNQSIGIYMDTLNIFIRIAMMLAGSNRKRK